MLCYSEGSTIVFKLTAVLFFSGEQNPHVGIFLHADEQMFLVHAWALLWHLV